MDPATKSHLRALSWVDRALRPVYDEDAAAELARERRDEFELLIGDEDR